MEIKVFRFTVSNEASSPYGDDNRSEWFAKRRNELRSPQYIEDTINYFLGTVNRVIDIRVNTVDVLYHNNGRGNTIDLVYTVLYE